jgi:hypothetical protein
VSESVEILSSTERIARYRVEAETALQRATSTFHQETREGLLGLAAAWHALADELERAPEDVPAVQDIAIADGREQPK